MSTSTAGASGERSCDPLLIDTVMRCGPFGTTNRMGLTLGRRAWQLHLQIFPSPPRFVRRVLITVRDYQAGYTFQSYPASAMCCSPRQMRLYDIPAFIRGFVRKAEALRTRERAQRELLIARRVDRHGERGERQGSSSDKARDV